MSMALVSCMAAPVPSPGRLIRVPGPGNGPEDGMPPCAADVLLTPCPRDLFVSTSERLYHQGSRRNPGAKQKVSMEHPDQGSASPAEAPANPAGEPAGATPANDSRTNHLRETFDTDKTFADLGLRPAVLEGLTKRGFKHPTRIQAALIPVALTGRDVLGQAKTGTGKTAAFGLPLLQQLDPDAAFSALVLVPTRELAIQVAKELQELGAFAKVQTVPVYGGQPIDKQVQALKKNPPIIVGTPGRVMDLEERRILPFEHFRFAILDEVDRMLDIGFRDDIRKILGKLRKVPQTMFVSATISPEIEKLARSYMKDPEKIVTFEKSLTVSQVNQSYFTVERWDKRKLLLHLFRKENPALTIVFCRTKRAVDDVTDYLNDKRIEAHAMHGDMYQKKRDKVMSMLRDGQLKVLVASDLAARGLDVDDVTHVVNYDMPEDPEVYIHRIGRTARAGRTGVAWSFVTPDQGDLLTNIEMLANVEIPKTAYDDFKPGPVPSDVAAVREHEAKRREDAQQMRNRSSGPSIPVVEAVDTSMFPDGIVPTALPGRRLGGRVRTGRR
jgi:ATP-dependent RNA helicase DeaD